MLAAFQGHTATVNALVGTHHANVEAVDENGWTALMIAAYDGKIATVNALAGTHNANVNATGESNETALMCAAKEGHTATVNALAGTHHANVEAVDLGGHTALMCAALHGHADTVSALVRTHNANVDAVDELGMTARFYAELTGVPLGDATGDNPILLGDDTVLAEPLPCTICHEHMPKIRFHPCGHTACRGCSRSIHTRGQNCHVCRQPIHEMQPLYL
jgi:hypothetical protein